MKLLTLAATLLATAVTAPATMAQTVRAGDAASGWSWTPIRNGSTLDAHLARDELARPHTLPIFATIEALAAPNKARS